MKLKITNKQKRITRECIAVLSLFIICICAYLGDTGCLKIPELFILKITNQEDLFFNLFGVQATISSVGIAIIALLSGANTESAYGICFSRYISHIKPLFLKHNRLIIANLIITLVNYFVVSYQLFNLSISLFFASIMISVKLVKDTYVIFLGRKELKKQISEYVLNNYDTDLLEDFSRELNDPEQLKNLSYTKENLELLEKILKKELENINTDDKSEIFKIIEEISIESSSNILKKNDSQLTMLVLNYLLNIYTIANKNDSRISLDIWEGIIPEFFNSLKTLMQTQLSDSGVFFDLYRQLYHNKKFVFDKRGRMSNNSLKYYSTWLYNSLRNGQHRDSLDMDRITKRIYDDIVALYRYDNVLEEVKKDVLMAEMSIFAQNLIECGDVKNLTKLYFDVDFYPDEEYKEILLFIVLIYLYYLICREPLASNTVLKSNAEQIVKGNLGNIRYFIGNVNISKINGEKLDFIRNLMHTWEVMPEGEAKTMVIDNVINDFIVFCALERYYSRDELQHVVYNICPDSSFSIYTSFFSGDGKRISELFSDFQSVFYNKTEDSEFDEKIDLLRNVLYEKYKLEELKEGLEQQITDEDKKRISKLIDDEIHSIINKDSALFNSEIDSEGTVISNELILNMRLPNITFREDTLNTFISRELHNILVGRFLYTLKEYIVVERAGAYDRDIQERFIKLVKVNDIKGDTYLGNRDIFWNEENKNLLKDFVASMNTINYSKGYSQIFILDSTSIQFKYSNVRIEFDDLTEDEIEEKCKVDENGVLLYNVTNDIFIPFNKEELTEHVYRIYKKVKVYVDILYKIDGRVGAGMIIEQKTKDNE